MKRSFLFDLGFHHGEGLEYLTELYAIDESWSVFCFEPNSACRRQLMRAGYLRHPRITAMPFAAHTKAGPVLFQREAVVPGGAEDGQASHLAEIEFGIDCRGAGHEVVWAVDFPAFLCSLVPPDPADAFVVVKMDIEGAEYGILRSMLADGSIHRVDVLHLEFHQRLMSTESDDSTGCLRDEIQAVVTLIEHW